MINYTIDNKVTTTTNKNKCHCFKEGCNKVLNRGEGFPVWIPSRGLRYTCEQHSLDNGFLGYHGNANNRRNNDIILGTEKITKLAQTTVGIEIEYINNISDVAFNSARALIEKCFYTNVESDCTVQGEFPTEKMQGLATVSKVLQSLEKHNQLSIFNNQRCGHHIHAYCSKVPYIRRYYHSIFLPLANYIYNMNTDKRIDVFGSDFRSYASMIYDNSNALNHSNIFNTQHEHTLEFRLPRIISYRQYMENIKFWREVCFTINSYDLNENADATTRKKHAKALGNELVEIAKKYF